MAPVHSFIMSSHPDKSSGVFKLPFQSLSRESDVHGKNATEKKGCFLGCLNCSECLRHRDGLSRKTRRDKDLLD
jgi:hypothetical protein